MTRYLIRRLLWAVLLFFAVTVVSYILFFVIPADPARQFAGKGATAATIAKAKHYLHLDEPIYQQYGRFVWRLVYHHDLGHSYYNRESVNHIIADAAPVTASLVIGGAIFWMLIAVPIGILSALRPRSLLDRGAMTFVLIGISAHPIWIGLIFAWLFGYKWGLTPITGYADVFNPPPGQPGGPVQWAYHLILPWMTFMILFAALYVRMIRANVIETLGDCMLEHGVPEHVRSDNGAEMTAERVRKWLQTVGTQPLYIEPGNPWENGYCDHSMGNCGMNA